MKDIVNARDILKRLAHDGLNIGDKSVFMYYIKNFNYNTFIHGYSIPFYLEGHSGRYDPEATSDEMVHLYKFDRDMANHILRFILVVEKILNTNVAYEIINEHNLKDKCLLKLQPQYIEQRVMTNLRDVEPRTSYYNFIRKIIKYLPTSHMTKPFCQKNIRDDVIRWRNCPVDVMCLTWSFATTFSLFIALDNNSRERILNNFGLQACHLNGFIDFLKNTLHLRNAVSHNNVIYDIHTPYQSPSLNAVYEYIFNRPVKMIKLLEMMQLIEHFSHSSTLVSNTRYYYNKLKIADKFKKRLHLFEDQNDQVLIQK